MPELAPAPVIRAPIPARSENVFRSSRPAPRENRPVRSETQSTHRFTPLPDRILSARDRLTLWIAEKRHQNPPQPESVKPAEKPIRPFSKDQYSATARDRLSTIAGIKRLDHLPPKRHVSLKIPLAEKPIHSPHLQVQHEQPKRFNPLHKDSGRSKEMRQKLPISVKGAEALVKQATEQTRQPIPKDEFKTLHPSEHFFKNIPKLKEIPKTNQETAGSVPESRIVAEKNMATPYEVYKRQDMKGQTIFVIRKLHAEALPMKLIKDDGEAQNIKADNGRDVIHTLAFQTKESGKNKYFRLEETADLTMRFVEITDKKQIAKVIAKRQEYARKRGILPKRDSLRDHPGFEVKASQKRQDHFYTWHDMLNKISMRSIQTLGKAHIVCDRSLPPEKASVFSKKFIEAYYSEKYEGLSIEERTKQAYMDTLKELGMEQEPSVATYLVTHENTAYMGGTGGAKVTASYADSLDETKPPNVFRPEQVAFKNDVFAIDGRELVLDDDTPEVSPDNGIQLILHPDE